MMHYSDEQHGDILSPTEKLLALKLADALMDKPDSDGHCRQAAAELRRLHAENAELTENLEKKSVAIQRIWKERDELRNENEALREALKFAKDAVEDWGSYADEYFKNKYRLADDVERINAALARAGEVK